VSSARAITCKELTEVLTDYLEGTMALEDRAALEAHLALCEGCATYVDQMRQVIRTVHALRVADVEATAPDSLLEAFRAWKRGEPVPET
jgi:predicted anti-sigma-YlaC factor YlaD